MSTLELDNIYSLFHKVEGLEELGKSSWRKIDAEVKILTDFLPLLMSAEYQLNTLKIKRIINNLALYYPQQKDISITTKNKVMIQSLIHEIGHHIDFINGSGRKYSSDLMKDEKWIEVVHYFRKQYEKHRQKSSWIYVQNGVMTKTKEEWNSRDKLYRNRKEIFARSFEIYIAHQLNLNEIIETKSHYKEQKHIYPMSKKAVELICSFYDAYFQKINQKENLY